MNEQEFLQVAREAAEAAADVIRHYYRRDVAVEHKADASPVTVADLEAERTIRETLLTKFPGHAFFGEESGHSGRSDAEYVWLVDPIDGTKSFIRRQPFFSTQIALRHRGQCVVGVSSAPLFGETAWAARGLGAFLNGERIRVSTVDDVHAAQLSTGNIASLAANHAVWSRYGKLLQDVNRVRGYGDFYHYHLLARGALDVVIESDLNILDIAALGLIVEEAGGRFTTLAGDAINDSSSSVLATNGRLHAVLLERIGWRD